MTNEQIQALLEKAESDDLALNGNEISNQLRHLADNEIDSDSFAVVTENYNGMETEFERPITDLAIDAAVVIDSLLAERDTDKKRITELEGALSLASASFANERMRADALQAHTLTVKLPEWETGEAAKFGRGADVVLVQVVREMLAAANITLVVGE